MNARLIFVYNAKAGLLAGALDSVHKVVSPATYACDLCAITHGVLTMRPEWREYLKSLTVPTEFFHKPDFRTAFPAYADVELPMVGLLNRDKIEVILDRVALSGLESANALIAALRQKLDEAGSVTP